MGRLDEENTRAVLITYNHLHAVVAFNLKLITEWPTKFCFKAVLYCMYVYGLKAWFSHSIGILKGVTPLNKPSPNCHYHRKFGTQMVAPPNRCVT